MNPALNEARKRRRTVVDAAIIFIVILLMVQMWLLTATLESYLAGRREAAGPSLAVSFVLFVAVLAFYRFILRIEPAKSR